MTAYFAVSVFIVTGARVGFVHGMRPDFSTGCGTTPGKSAYRTSSVPLLHMSGLMPRIAKRRADATIMKSSEQNATLIRSSQSGSTFSSVR